MMIAEFREWTMWLMEAGILYYVAREFYYDAAKDAKKQRRTRTIKKTTTDPQGNQVVEEQTSTVEGKNLDEHS